jgi:hypothetical protein
MRYEKPPYAVGFAMLFGVVKLGTDRSAERAISLEMCSKTYRPFVVVSLMAVVFAVLTIPLTKNATTATIRMHATPRVTTNSTIVKPTGMMLRRAPPRAELGWWPSFLMGPT